jgi:C1A family cysteine protease
MQAFGYDPTTCSRQPDTASLARAKYFKIQSWNTIPTTVADLKNSLLGGHPIIVAFAVYPDYFRLNATTNTTYDNTDGTKGACTVAPCLGGYHANAVVGYDDSRNAFKVINSWGTGWGSGGYGWIDYGFLTNGDLGLVAYIANDRTNPVGYPDSTFTWLAASGI